MFDFKWIFYLWIFCSRIFNSRTFWAGFFRFEPQLKILNTLIEPNLMIHNSTTKNGNIGYLVQVQVNFYLQTKKFSLKIVTKSNFSWKFAWAFWVLLAESQYSKGTPITYKRVPFEYWDWIFILNSRGFLHIAFRVSIFKGTPV